MTKLITIILFGTISFYCQGQRDIKTIICEDFTAEYDSTMTLKQKNNVYVREVLISINFIAKTKTAKDSIIMEIEKMCPTLANFKQELIKDNPLLLLNSDEYWRALYNMENEKPWKAGKVMKVTNLCINRMKKQNFELPEEICNCFVYKIKTLLSDKEYDVMKSDEKNRIMDRIRKDYCYVEWETKGKRKKKK